MAKRKTQKKPSRKKVKKKTKRKSPATRIREKNAEIRTLTTKVGELEGKLEVAQETAKRVPDLEASISQKGNRIETLVRSETELRASVQQHEQTVSEFQRRLTAKEVQIQNFQEQIGDLRPKAEALKGVTDNLAAAREEVTRLAGLLDTANNGKNEAQAEAGKHQHAEGVLRELLEGLTDRVLTKVTDPASNTGDPFMIGGDRLPSKETAAASRG